MKFKLTLVLIAITLLACKEDKSNAEKTTKEQPLTIAQKIANAHGFEHWKHVKSFEFTFGGKAEDANSGRAWVWHPKTNDVTLKRDTTTFQYNRNSMDSLAIRTDRAFINDKFWALIPFQLVWDEGLTVSEPEMVEAPISKQQLQKVTMTYSSEGGYTPGDAYDLYVNDKFIIKEWAFRRGNAEKPSIINTFENYKNHNGILVAQEHKRDSTFNLLIRNVNVKMEN